MYFPDLYFFAGKKGMEFTLSIKKIRGGQTGKCNIYNFHFLLIYVLSFSLFLCKKRHGIHTVNQKDQGRTTGKCNIYNFHFCYDLYTFVFFVSPFGNPRHCLTIHISMCVGNYICRRTPAYFYHSDIPANKHACTKKSTFMLQSFD
jgi:hypothetical protein